MGGERLERKSWEQLRREAGWLGILAVSVWLNAVIALLFYGGVLSAIFGAIAGLMAWTPSFIDLRAQGKRTLSDRGRIMAGLICLVVSGAAYPSSEKTKEPSATPTEVSDVQAGPSMKAAAQVAQSSEISSALSKVDAFRQCQQATLGKLNHPSTANFNGWDTTFEQIGSESRFSVGLTAKNAMGLELKLLSTCVFDGDNLTLNHIAETR